MVSRQWKVDCTAGNKGKERAMSSAVRIFIPRNLIPLPQAVLCANCEVVSDSKNGHCIVCGSPSLLNLARVLDGSDQKAEKAWMRPRKIRASLAARCASERR